MRLLRQTCGMAIDLERYMFIRVGRKDNLDLLRALLWQEQEFLQLQFRQYMGARSIDFHRSSLGHLNIN